MIYKTFKSRKDSLFAWIIVWVIVIMVGIPGYQYMDTGLHPSMLIHVVNLAVIGFLGWLWFATYYTVDDTHIHYRSGPLRGKIAIAAIREVKRDTTLWVGFRPALARKGIIVKYNKYDDIYFSPDSNDAFIKALLEVRPDIPVTGA